MTTIVTCYFKINSKHSHEKYKTWMENMLSIDNPMVIFCDKESFSFIDTQRKNNTKIIITSLEEFYSYKYIDTFYENNKIDFEVNIGHTPELYLIWSEKIHFVKLAIEMNPFQSNYFLWVDIGCFREKKYIEWPNPERIQSLDSSKILSLLIEPFEEKELNCTKKTLPVFHRKYRRIGATIFGGGKEVLLKYNDLYYDMLEYFISIGHFIGKDQNILNSVYLLNQEMFDLVQWKECNDIWFYLQDYLN